VDVTILSLVNGQQGNSPRTQVLACADALRAGGAQTRLTDAFDDEGIDGVVTGSDRIIVAADSDAQLRAVVRRAVRCLAPAPSNRPQGLPDDRTLPDLPPLGVLPLAQQPELVSRFGLPSTPQAVAAAVLAGTVKRTDLLRHDGGGVTLHGVRIGGGDRPWRAKIALDDTTVTDGSEPLITSVVANGGGYGVVEGLPLCEPDPYDGKLNVAVAVPVVYRGLLKRRTRIEVRRSTGRAVAITPIAPVAMIDDGAVGELNRKRTWWMERAAAGWYADS
jgi:hypothetical protein